MGNFYEKCLKIEDNSYKFKLEYFKINIIK
jgi:hypothetical protein